MITYQEALEMIETQIPRPSLEEAIPLAAAFGRVLSRGVASDMSLPPFDKATMDGFAVRAADLVETPVTLDVVGDIAAGTMPGVAIGPGQAASVMTGAPVPEGADAVVMVEWTSGFGKHTVAVNRSVTSGTNISLKGEIVDRGTTVLETGTRVGVEASSLLAMTGCDPVWVFERPTVAILSTGDELVAPGKAPGPAQIRDSNGPALTAFLRMVGLEPVDLGRVGDDLRETKDAIERGLAYDFLLVSGGVSAGAYDFVEDVLTDLGVNIHFHRVAVKPGKPIVFGRRDEKVVFGLPGNPVSAIVVARIFVWAALRIRMGMMPRRPRTVRARLTAAVRKKADRLWFVPATVHLGDAITATPLKSMGSADIPTMARANSVIVAPRGDTLIPQDTAVDVVVWGEEI